MNKKLMGLLVGVFFALATSVAHAILIIAEGTSITRDDTSFGGVVGEPTATIWVSDAAIAALPGGTGFIVPGSGDVQSIVAPSFGSLVMTNSDFTTGGLLAFNSGEFTGGSSFWYDGINEISFAYSVGIFDVSQGAPVFDTAYGNLSYRVVVPEPSTLVLLSLGLAGLCFTRRRMKA
jgi:hypothetical protein